MGQLNRDELLGYNVPRAGYALSGSDWAINQGKDAPMIINLNTPGTFGDDWVNTYGASLDSFLSIVDGFKIVESINTMTVDGIYADAFPNVKTDNIWQPVEPSPALVSTPTMTQQIQYVVSGGNIEEGRERINEFGNLFNVRGLCMRAPMMVCGYGRTKDMLPLFPKEFDERKNEEDAKLDRAQWKTGTLDARWDERRNVWAAWQDIIVDHEAKGLGTTVFSTNPDVDKGFPYLKGKLEDVWWVRQPDSLKGTDGKVEGQQTAEIMTHLKHKFFDESTDGSAKLETVFIIPHKDASEEDDACHKKGEERTLGDETTGDGLAIDIRSTVHFWKADEVDGPVKFGEKKSDLGDKVSCINEDACLFIGEMVFLDEAVITCASRNIAAGADTPPAVVEEGDPPCEWVPAVRIDECELVGGHFGTLYENDETLANRINTLCVEINGYSKDLQDAVKANDSTAIGLAAEACAKVVELAKGVTDGFGSIIAQVQAGFVDAQGQIGSAFDELNSQLNAAFAACECPIGVSLAPDFTFGSNLSSPKVDSTPCAATVGNIPEFDCAKCVSIDLKAPCSVESRDGEATFKVGAGCDGASFPRPTYDDTIGSCQANPSL